MVLCSLKTGKISSCLYPSVSPFCGDIFFIYGTNLSGSQSTRTPWFKLEFWGLLPLIPTSFPSSKPFRSSLWSSGWPWTTESRLRLHLSPTVSLNLCRSACFSLPSVWYTLPYLAVLNCNSYCDSWLLCLSLVCLCPKSSRVIHFIFTAVFTRANCMWPKL